MNEFLIQQQGNEELDFEEAGPESGSGTWKDCGR